MEENDVIDLEIYGKFYIVLISVYFTIADSSLCINWRLIFF